MFPTDATWDAPPVAKEGDCLQLLVSAKCANLIIMRMDDDDDNGDDDDDRERG